MGFLLAVGWGAGQPAFHASAQRLIKRQSIILVFECGTRRSEASSSSRGGASAASRTAGKTELVALASVLEPAARHSANQCLSTRDAPALVLQRHETRRSAHKLASRLLRRARLHT